MSRMLVTILDAAEDNIIAPDTLLAVSNGLLNQAARLYGEIDIYTSDLHSTS